MVIRIGSHHMQRSFSHGNDHAANHLSRDASRAYSSSFWGESEPIGNEIGHSRSFRSYRGETDFDGQVDVILSCRVKRRFTMIVSSIGISTENCHRS